MKIPEISVVIPMYNTEKYIGECLESILAQTFQDFEVIVVNNCSTDNSCAVVKNFSDNRIKLAHTKKNFGYPSLPRNFGLEISRGKYIFFMDSDDILIKNSLEIMFTYAEKFQADVVNCTASYQFDESDKNKKHISKMLDIEQPVFMSENLSERLNAWFRGIFFSPPLYKFSRRDFLVYNEIKFDKITREDDLWTLKLVCLAKKYLMIPEICYIKRNNRGDNITTKKRTVNEYVNYWFGRSVRSFKILDEFTAEIEFFQKNPEIRYMVLNSWLSGDLSIALGACAESNLSLNTIYEMFQTEFKEYFGENNAFISALITNNITNMFNLMIANQEIMKLKAK